MTGIDYFALFVLVIVFVCAIAVFILIAIIPGKMARERNHPQAEAINIGGWMGALFGGIFWSVFLVWAFTKPIRITKTNQDDDPGSDAKPDTPGTVKELKAREAELEKQLKNVRQQLTTQKARPQTKPQPEEKGVAK